MTPRPEWWDWEIELTPHVLKRMVDRGFAETELRKMLDDATGIRSSTSPHRWIASARLDTRDWEIVVEPLHDEQVILVITAYAVG